jgi:hypothetical protein
MVFMDEYSACGTGKTVQGPSGEWEHIISFRRLAADVSVRASVSIEALPRVSVAAMNRFLPIPWSNGR